MEGCFTRHGWCEFHCARAQTPTEGREPDLSPSAPFSPALPVLSLTPLPTVATCSGPFPTPVCREHLTSTRTGRDVSYGLQWTQHLASPPHRPAVCKGTRPSPEFPMAQGHWGINGRTFLGDEPPTSQPPYSSTKYPHK